MRVVKPILIFAFSFYFLIMCAPWVSSILVSAFPSSVDRMPWAVGATGMVVLFSIYSAIVVTNFALRILDRKKA